MRNSLRFSIRVFLLVVLYSYTSIASPNGGSYNEAPPKFVSSASLSGQINYRGKKIEIVFDELIQIGKPTKSVTITPPQMERPAIRANGRRAVIELMDMLKENTTYTIGFTDSISDSSEKNISENCSLAFSTDESIDSMEVSGVLLNAGDLEPMPGITVGIHTNLEDPILTTIPSIHTSRTGDKGEFTIRNMTPGTHRIYILEDVICSCKYSQPGRQIASYDSSITPVFELTTHRDTVWKDSLMVDTVITVGYTRFMPDNTKLHLFKEKVERQYMLKPGRTGEKTLTLRFNASLGTTPIPIPLNSAPVDNNRYPLQTAKEGKAVRYQLTDSSTWRQSTLQVEVNHLKGDSVSIPRSQTDMVQSIMCRRPVEKKRRKKDDEPEPIEFLGMNVNASGLINLYDTIAIMFSEPVAGLAKDHFCLSWKMDTSREAVDFDFFPDTTNSLGFFIECPRRCGEEHRLEIDSATAFSAYGKWDDAYSGEFKIKKGDKYGHLYINTEGAGATALVELLNSSDQPIREVETRDGGVSFVNLEPGKYYARLVLNANDNGVWDTGNYANKRQPELVFYCPKTFNIMQNWQVEEVQNIKVTPMKRQKPVDITKNKPKELTKKKRGYKNGETQSLSNRNNDVDGLRL